MQSILSGVCAELAEDFETFARRVCNAVHDRPTRIANLERQIQILSESLKSGGVVKRTSPRIHTLPV